MNKWQPGFGLKKPPSQSTIYITFSFQPTFQLSPRFTIIIPQSEFSRIEAVANQKLVLLVLAGAWIEYGLFNLHLICSYLFDYR